MSEGPNLWRDLFSDQGLIQAFMGGLGGGVRALRLRTSWREGLRVILIGAATAFGAGVFAPSLLRPYVGDLPETAGTAFGMLAAASFLIGLLAVTIIEKVIDQQKVDGEDAD